MQVGEQRREVVEEVVDKEVRDVLEMLEELVEE